MASDRRPPLRRALRCGLLATQLAGGLSCAGDGVRRFPLRDPLWTDPDATPVAIKPAKRATTGWTLPAEQAVLRPLSRALTLPLRHEAVNVNSLDEVPASSWFTNRIGWFPMTPAEVARGACGQRPPLDPARGPWMVVSGKPDGTTKGFVIEAPDGQRYLLKFDGVFGAQRPTSADVIGSKIYHAAGYNTPCNEIVTFPDSVLQLAPGATQPGRYGAQVPLTPSGVADILTMAWRRPDGLVRASASRYLEGSPLGPFRFEGVRPDDPNDVVPHQQRREIRASMLFAAWIHHWDAIENNTLDMLVGPPGARYVRHHFLDWSDGLGAMATGQERINQRVGIGRASYLQFGQVVVDFFTLGLYPRPWYHLPTPAEAEAFGYFDAEHFVASKWRPTYANPAFSEMTLADALWATRIIARFSDADVAAIVAEARLDDPRARAYLTQTLIERRDRIVREYLTRGSPLDRFTLGAPGADGRQRLCFEDLALATGAADPATTSYRVHFHGGAALERLLGWNQLKPDPANPAHSCLTLPAGRVRPADLAGASASPEDPRRYGVVEIYSSQHPAFRASAATLVHLHDGGPGPGFRVVGIERPEVVPDTP